MITRLLLSSILLLILTPGCKTYSVAKFSVVKAPIEPLLPALTKSVDYHSSLLLAVNSDQYELFDEEVDNNLTNPYGEKYGYIVLRTYFTKYRLGLGYAVASGAMLMIPDLIGFPMGRPNFEILATVEILNARKELIGKYKAAGEGKSVIALYYGYTQNSALRKAQSDALKAALADIRKQIQDDAGRLSMELQNAGPIQQ
jgi:hypothetical protein